jgi:hypothetical protein
MVTNKGGNGDLIARTPRRSSIAEGGHQHAEQRQAGQNALDGRVDWQRGPRSLKDGLERVSDVAADRSLTLSKEDTGRLPVTT